MIEINTIEINKNLQDKTPHEIIGWALSIANRPMITTNFRPYESAILHAVVRLKNNIEVIWCDTGYNTSETYNHANELIEKLGLNIQLFIPKQTVAYRNTILGIPEIDDPKHELFTYQVKLEPFNRAMVAHQPDIWFTNLRKGQTSFRNSIDIVSIGSNGIIKISPFYNWTDEALDQYLINNGLPNEFEYYDPTKQLENRECGLHT